MKMYAWLINLVIATALVQSSIVRDAYFDKNKIIEKYCPKIGQCEEGTHVMCMYYNPRERMGKQCHDVRDVQIRSTEAVKLMEISNMIRGNIARGKETGRDGLALPRAYGMYRLEWDEELASFAQVLANQCLLRHDLCRASDKFPDPGQTTGIVRFSYPDWYSIAGTAVFPPGLSDEKLLYSITHIMQSWYLQKSYVSPDMVHSYPNWSDHLDKVAGKLYLEMIVGEATHMGCGISAYAEYAYHANNADLSYNNIQVVCNYSAKPRKGEPVYNTKPPTDNDIGFTVKCGCPVGYDEDYNCLCYRSDRKISKTCEGDRCKPSIVLLPIFTVEDAPAHKMIHSKAPENKTLKIQDSVEILDHFDNFKENPRRVPKLFVDNYPSSQRNLEHKLLDVRRRYFDKPINKTKIYTLPSKRIIIPPKIKQQKSKKSIFVRSAVFVLPTRMAKKESFMVPTIKKDVVPRKDFSKVKKLVTTYLNRRRNGKMLIINEKKIFNHTILKVYDKTTEKPIKTTINIFNINHYLKDAAVNDYNVTKKPDVYKHEGDKKLIHLLDDLRLEVKQMDFDSNEKDIFDANLREIYNSLTRSPKETYYKTESTDKNSSFKEQNQTRFDRLSVISNEVRNIDSYPVLSNKRYFDKMSPKSYQINDLSDYQKDSNDKNVDSNYRRIYAIRRKNKDLYKYTGNEDIRKNFYLRNDNAGEILSNDRRKYYQEKLDNLERKLQTMRRNYRRKNTVSDDNVIRPLRSSTAAELLRPEQTNAFYLPDRARFLHGF